MYRKTTRWLALLLALLTCGSFLVLPVMAAEGADTEEEGVAVVLPEEDAPLVNVIETEEPAEEPAEPAEETTEPAEETTEPAEEPAEPAEETAEPAEETTEPAEETTEPAEETTEPAEETTEPAEETTEPAEETTEPAEETTEPAEETTEPAEETTEPAEETTEPAEETTEPAEETTEPAEETSEATDEPAEATEDADSQELIIEEEEEEIVQTDAADAAVLDADPEAEAEASGEPSELDGAEEGPFKISYYNGKTLLAEEEVEKGKAPAKAPTDVDGRSIKAWTDKKGKLVTLSELEVEADAAYYAWFMPQLKTEEHARYINGTGSAKFSPTSALTRAQAATILYQLLDSTKEGPYNNTFKDVSDGAWYTAAVKTLASIGVVNGYTDGTFRPERAVSRAEFVTMLVNLTGVTGKKASFTDIKGHWARKSILAAASQGWINGYETKSGKYQFKPDNRITRAEAVVIMNRVLGRSADKETLSTGENILHYLDVKETDWWYGDVMEASIGHTYSKSGAKETWTNYNVETLGLKAGLQKIDSSYVYVKKNGQLAKVSAGITKLGGKYFFAASAGYTIDADLSSKANKVVFANGAADQKLTNGFNRIGTALFYWNRSKKAPTALKAGLNTIAGKTYWADAKGYIIRNDFGKGVVTLGGKKYLSDGSCAVITSGVACATGKEASKPSTISLKDHTVEFNGSMYYLNSDYTVATNTWKGLLYFGKNGKYTTGDSTLDGYVYNIIKDFVNNTAITQVQKLLKAYYHLRGGEGETFEDSGYGYRQIGHAYMKARYNGQTTYDWTISTAKYMFKNQNGMCYEWATALLYLARRLGFQAYIVVGDITPNALHCWNLIKWGGKWHISDVEIEWGWMQGYYGGGRRLYRNLFDQTLSTESVTSYTNPECGITYKFPS